MMQQLKKDGEKAAANLEDAELKDKERNLMQLELLKNETKIIFQEKALLVQRIESLVNEKEVLVSEKTALVKRIENLVNDYEVLIKKNKVLGKKIENSGVLEEPSGILVLLGFTLLLVLGL
jgi:hypothetical protein